MTAEVDGLAREPVVDEAATARGGEGRQGDEERDLEPCLQCNHLLPLEPEVLERFCSAPVELCGHLVLTAPHRKVALGDPRGRTMTY